MQLKTFFVIEFVLCSYNAVYYYLFINHSYMILYMFTNKTTKIIVVMK